VQSKKTVALIGTLDTKGAEIAYARDKLLSLGVNSFVIDSGIMGLPGMIPDMTREEVAQLSGRTLLEIQNSGGRGNAVELMQVGLAKAVSDLYDAGTIQGLLCFGGAEGALMGAHAAQALPIGVPKVIVSPSASGRREFGPFIGKSDIVVMHSVIDILGLNAVSKSVFDNAVAAIAGMVSWGGTLPKSTRPCVGITMLGQTTPGVMVLAKDLDDAGYETVIFLANGIGGPAMDDLVASGVFVGVIDFTISELANSIHGGLHATSDSRMRAAVTLGIPLLVVPGAADFFNLGAVENLPKEFLARKHYRHNTVATLVRINPGESAILGEQLAKRLSGATAPTCVVFPTKGLSLIGVVGGPLHDACADSVLAESCEKHLPAGIGFERVDLDINNEKFGHHVATKFLELMKQHRLTQR
jgi:uncharacterized protein (UPF0261 family)